MRAFGTINAVKYTFATYNTLVLQTSRQDLFSSVACVDAELFVYVALSTWVATINTIAPNETNSSDCSKFPFKDYFIIKQQPENGNLVKYR